MADESAKKLAGFNAQNLANTVWAFANLGFNPGAEILNQLAAAAEARLAQFSSQNIANTLNAFAKLEHCPSSLLPATAKAAMSKLGEFNAQALSNTLWAVSKLGYEDEALMHALASCVTAKIATFNAQNIANSVWAYANLQCHPGTALLDAAASIAEQSMPHFSAQNLSNTMWSFAKLSYLHKGLFTAGTSHAAKTLGRFQPQSVANMALFSGIALELCNRLAGEEAQAFSRQHLSNTVWAFGTLEREGQPRKRLMSAIAAAMVDRVAECNPQEISNTCWAFAKLRYYDEKLLEVMAAEALKTIASFSQQNLANLAWAYGKLAHFHSELLGAIADRASQMIKDLSLQHVTNILWAFASLFYLPGEALQVFVEEVRTRLAVECFNPQQLANLVWALSISKLCTVDIWNAIMGQITNMGADTDLVPEALTQIYQAHLLMEIDQAGQVCSTPPHLLRQASATWREATRNVRISQLHSEVSQALTALGEVHEMEHLVEGDLFSLDMAIPGERIGIEADGPHHYTANTLSPTGFSAQQRADFLKQAMMTARQQIAASADAASAGRKVHEQFSSVIVAGPFQASCDDGQ
ncbi:hypothetical protein WJX73_003116 [Symbiochloris irregularis]|uniref:RAP domain-containing protein n=1 Tax=Symbiochloris irregularis TaxID=706552 RepID=A0AAW1PZZ0_9CHLO